MNLTGLDWLTLGWLAAAAATPGGDHVRDGWSATAWLARMGRSRPSGSKPGPLVGAVAAEEMAYAELRLAGRNFALNAVEATKPHGASDKLTKPDAQRVSDGIRDHAAWWAETLRNNGVNARLAERFVASFVTAAHETLLERVDLPGALNVTRREDSCHR